MIRILPLALLSLSSVVSAQGGRTFDVPGFNSIDLRSPDTIRILPTAAPSVLAEGDPRAIEALEVGVERGILRIERKAGRHTDHGAVVTVGVAGLKALSVSGAGVIDAEGLKTDDLAVRSSDAGRLALAHLEAHRIHIVASGAGSVTVSGHADTAAIDSADAGTVDASNLRTSALSINLSGAADVSAYASDTARIAAGGSGNVRVSGHPRCAVRKTGTASIVCS